MKTFVSLAGLAIAGLSFAACSTSDGDPCAAMNAKIAQCFPDVATADQTCNEDVADRVDGMSCDELSHLDGKADDWSCVWMPWLPSCGSGGGDSGSGGSSSSTSGKKIEVSTEECGGEFGCEGVSGVSCAMVTLSKGSTIVSRGYSSNGGRFTFSGLANGDYTVKVLHRDNTIAKMMADPYTSDVSSASIKVTCTSSGCKSNDEQNDNWARFELVNGTGAKATRCADLDGEVKLKNKSGAAVDKRLVEWDWLYEVEKDGAVFERSRPLYISNSAGSDGKNVIDARDLLAGTYTVRFYRMDIPEYKQKPNPDYAQLLEDYKADGVDPIELSLTVTSAQATGKTVTFNKTITDPLR
ncbi:MAG TPA: carboxypeptidase-like regulatory domain-containing protein [Kofleriaceae bacterium]|jgi:hypothetical protein